jgi:hypothetical protein
MTDRNQVGVPAGEAVGVVRVTEDDWRDVRAVRLSVLTEAPTASDRT